MKPKKFYADFAKENKVTEEEDKLLRTYLLAIRIHNYYDIFNQMRVALNNVF